MASNILSVFLFVAALTIVSVAATEDQTPFDCPANEHYIKCQLEVCIKTCDHLRNAPPCPSIAPGCFDPACVCDRGFLRNANGICVHIDECGHDVPEYIREFKAM
ncbi:venom serine protease inhibitor-like isoform X2 [Spodoptera frugiperda]|uniref:Venom serine protease inhibitor-like isoform X2 n=1 Tax=Spodoptera frugiperda TaxID=7108 RepID=A0A9R0EBW3_SPOFR|nr:venom serine protease inhibitor-like isoform X2 [Spodoptera frugiperda]